MRLAKVTVTPALTLIDGPAPEARDSLDFDPISLPTVTVPNLGVLVATDYAELAALVDQLANEEAERQIVTFDLVWEADGAPVRACCPKCGHVGNVTADFLGVDGAQPGLVCHSCV